MKIKNKIIEWIEFNSADYESLAQQLWNNPELAMEEYKSSELLAKMLEKNGFNVKRGVADLPTAFVAEYGTEGPVIGFSAEFDALSGMSQEAVPERKVIVKDGPGHGCGHNILGVAGIMAAIALKDSAEKDCSKVRIKVFGTPAEELCIGKPFMGRAGLFEGLDAILDWHPYYFNKSGYETYCAYFNTKYHFKGRSCHGNAPWQGRSALDAAVLAGHGVEMLREHIPPGPEESPNTINYTFPDVGGFSPGVVPEKSTIWVIGRAANADLVVDIMDRVENCAKGAAIATGTSYEKEFITATHEKIINVTLAEVMHENFTEVGAPKFTKEEQEFVMELQKSAGLDITGISEEILPFGGGVTAVTDATEYTWNAPYTSLFVAAAPNNIWWHNWTITACMGTSIAGKAMITAAKVLASTAADLVEKPEILVKAQKEFKERMKGKVYKSLIPEGLRPPVKNKEE